jgi:cell wall-associated NlpC family hydrolase
MASKLGAYSAVVAGGLFVYSAVTGRKVIDVLLMRDTQPATAGAGSAGPGMTAPRGSREGVVQAAQAAVAKPQSNYVYSATRPYPPNLFGPPLPVKTDCSGFVTLCYKEAGAPDPNGMGYSGQGFTGSLLLRGRPTKSPKPGDLAFWHSPDHVAVYMGGGNIIEFGGPPAPIQGTISQENGYHASFIGYRTYLP